MIDLLIDCTVCSSCLLSCVLSFIQSSSSLCPTSLRSPCPLPLSLLGSRCVFRPSTLLVRSLILPRCIFLINSLHFHLFPVHYPYLILSSFLLRWMSSLMHSVLRRFLVVSLRSLSSPSLLSPCRLSFPSEINTYEFPPA